MNQEFYFLFWHVANGILILSWSFPLRRASLWFPTYLVYHEKGNKILKRLHDQLSELEWHEWCNRSKIFLNVTRGVIVAFGSKMDPLLLPGEKKLGTGGDPPAMTGGHPKENGFQTPRNSLSYSHSLQQRRQQLCQLVLSYPWPPHLPTPLSWEESTKIWLERLFFY